MEHITNILHSILYYTFVDPRAHPTLHTIQESGRWLIISAALFMPLALFFPNKKGQPHFRKDMWTDMVYWFSGPLVYGPIYGFFVVSLLAVIYSPGSSQKLVSEGLPPLRDLPIWLQAFLMLLATDILQYWAHRVFHSNRFWKFHSIHHSAEHVDWLTSARFHPVNIIIYSTFMNALVFLLGFSPTAFATLFVFNAIYSPLVHANLNWTYGPFKYFLASPVFHRWHHTHYHEGGNKNFAPTFPFIDLIFGTFYMPKDKRPENFGTVHDKVPDHFWGQIAYPFKKAPPPKGK
jgi:sterol desaturase/sphingolipid hydroxylase (fatty acid hydroxylase superfamily)